ncbi:MULTISPECIES: helix-turn-helix transcriptional regulator [unclassified Cupriavidus]|jgi:transcriptional regulator with XRE-family HTH domain|uniref:helix-turn-helix domain-containing protein n=1 Tax=unclassified Cupriavidus TaxID=2640874 RepID=UPI001C0014C4|nr:MULTISPECIES: helix-turn-helix transcriptional regulator [unclassified Cupriavidus]MCA3182907.1 helix-turn-helix transcriptional regulator [Cupriavidus sp.]MCA3190187.1 helix-turn-helix transcriptional regulator [Cupriavidus sp.]MCA3199662.1 helix-turn-helix transcriptional regulator [Cupriavidus sp.]MCA3205611.1 helix-turn-helix transcriptional regulator [Cupriavidus sp.]MCA3207122.1 helix-turn-helix transcriptional regulator [Cupriavidus sp.]
MSFLPLQLRSLRKHRGLSLTDIGRTIGMASSNLSVALSGKQDVRASTLDAIATALDAEWVLVPKEHLAEVRQTLAGKAAGPDRAAPTSVDLLLGDES